MALLLTGAGLFAVAGGGGGAGTTVYSRTQDGNEAGWGGSPYTFVSLLNAVNISAAAGSEARVTIEFAVLSSGATVQAYIGRQATVLGDTYDFLNTPTQLTFSGGDISGNGSTLVYVSDWVTLPESYDETVAMLVAFNLNGTTITLGKATDLLDVGLWNNGTSAATADKTGFVGNGAGSWIVTKLEIR